MGTLGTVFFFFLIQNRYRPCTHHVQPLRSSGNVFSVRRLHGYQILNSSTRDCWLSFWVDLFDWLPTPKLHQLGFRSANTTTSQPRRLAVVSPPNYCSRSIWLTNGTSHLYKNCLKNKQSKKIKETKIYVPPCSSSKPMSMRT